MSAPQRKRVRSQVSDMIRDDSPSTSLDHSSRKAMKIQKGRASCATPPGGRSSTSSTPPRQDLDGEEEEGEYVPNSDLEPALLRKIKTNRGLSKPDQEVVRLIGQHLTDLGLKTASDVLMAESGCRLDDPSSSTFRHCVMKGDWAGAINVLEDLKHHLEAPGAIKEMKYIILEQKYMEYIRDGKTFEALKVLQMEISSLGHSTWRTHQLSSYLMLPMSQLSLNNSFGATSGRSSESSASSSFSSNNNPDSTLLPRIPDRSEVMEKLQAFLPPSVMLPPRRLQALLTQASAHQRDQCIYHNRLGDDDPMQGITMDHLCSGDSYPCQTIQVLGDHVDEVMYCKWSPNGKLLATGSKDCTVIIWSLDPATLKLTHDKLLDGHTTIIAYFAWSPDSSKLAVCGPEDCPEVYIWDVCGGRLENKISQNQGDSLTSVSWSPDGRKLATGGSRGQFYQLDYPGNINNSWEGVRVQGLAYRADGQRILAADTHHRLRSYNFDDLKDDPVIQEDHPIMSFTVDQTDRYVLLNLANQGAHLWDLDNKCLVQKYKGISQGFYTVYSSFGGANQSFFASGSEDNKVYIYHVDRSEPIQVLSGHSKLVSCVSWNPVYHQVLVSASDDGTVRVWGPADQYRRNPNNISVTLSEN